MADVNIKQMQVPGNGDTLHFRDDSAASKVQSATNGDLAGLDSNGNLIDSGISASSASAAIASANSHILDTRVNLKNYTSSNKYTFPSDGYVRLYSEISDPLLLMVSDSTGREDTDHIMSIGSTGANTGVFLCYVKKGMTCWISPNAPFKQLGHLAMFYPLA